MPQKQPPASTAVSVPGVRVMLPVSVMVRSPLLDGAGWARRVRPRVRRAKKGCTAQAVASELESNSAR